MRASIFKTNIFYFYRKLRPDLPAGGTHTFLNHFLHAKILCLSLLNVSKHLQVMLKRFNTFKHV